MDFNNINKMNFSSTKTRALKKNSEVYTECDSGIGLSRISLSWLFLVTEMMIQTFLFILGFLAWIKNIQPSQLKFLLNVP